MAFSLFLILFLDLFLLFLLNILVLLVLILLIIPTHIHGGICLDIYRSIFHITTYRGRHTYTHLSTSSTHYSSTPSWYCHEDAGTYATTFPTALPSFPVVPYYYSHYY